MHTVDLRSDPRRKKEIVGGQRSPAKTWLALFFVLAQNESRSSDSEK